MKAILNFFSRAKNIFKLVKSTKERERHNDIQKEVLERKKEIASRIKNISLALNITAKDLVNEGNHPTIKGSIEKGDKNYTMDTFMKYLISIEKISNRKNKDSGRYVVDLIIGVINTH